MKVEIKSRWSGAVLFEGEFGLMKLCVMAAVEARADLSGAVLSDAALSGADLRGADLRGADLSGADLSGADLRGAVLRGAVLRDADLSDAALSGADLRGADLRGADLSGAVLSDADLSDATYGEGVPMTRAPLSILGLRWPVLILDAHVKIGCQLRTVAEWDSATDEQIVAMDGAPSIALWRRWWPSVRALAVEHQKTLEPVMKGESDEND
ncbi:MAG: pentapeptide repeat-containing protein [Bryobacteraceae bacterium]